MSIKCPYCKKGIMVKKLYRFVMNPDLPRDPWELRDPPVGWVEEEVRCVVCKGAGVVDEWESREKEEGHAPTFQAVKEEADTCEQCGSMEDAWVVEMSRRGSRQFQPDLLKALCVLCRAKKMGVWRWPSEKVRPLKVMNGGQR